MIVLGGEILRHTRHDLADERVLEDEAVSPDVDDAKRTTVVVTEIAEHITVFGSDWSIDPDEILHDLEPIDLKARTSVPA